MFSILYKVLLVCKRFLPCSMLLRFELLSLKYTMVKCLETDYRIFPNLVNIDFASGFEKKKMSVIVKLALFTSTNYSSNFAKYYQASGQLYATVYDYVVLNI